MSKCQGHTIPRPYLEVTALPLLAEVLGVCDLLAGLLEPREAVQLQAELTCGPQSANRLDIKVCVVDRIIRVITWRVADWCPLHAVQS